MALQTLTLKRVFKVGALSLPDPMPNGTLDDAIRVLSRTYPQFRLCRLYEEDGVPDIASGEISFTLQLPPPKKNG